MSRIVVGIDGSTGSDAALAWAAQEARVRHAELVILLAYEPPPAPRVVLAPVPYTINPVEVRHESERQEQLREQQHLAAQSHAETLILDGMNRVGVDPAHQEIALRPVPHPRPAEALVRASERADLVVVGSRGRGGFTALTLGSVSQQCLHHSRCPVAVVRGPQPAVQQEPAPLRATS